MPEIASRPRQLAPSAIGEMVIRAQYSGAINLASGDPDFDPPRVVVEAAIRALQQGHNQLTDSRGMLPFRVALANKASRFMGIDFDPAEHITATAGSTEAILASVLTVCDPGDRVIIFSPFYEAHLAAPLLCDVEPVMVPLAPPEFSLDLEALRAALQRGAKALILCSPSNPSGKVFTLEELEAVAALAREFNIFVITDNVYEHIVYPPHQQFYMASLNGMFERTLSCGSLSKTYHMTGWRLGYIIAHEDLTRVVRTVHDFISLSAPEPLLHAAIDALRLPDSYYAELQSTYARRLGLFSNFLDRAGLAFIPPQGAFYILLDISPFGFERDEEFCYWMLERAGVAAAPGSSFFSPAVQRYVRLSFAKRDSTLIEAGERLVQLATSL
jgi:aspartate/methionine/tyrosine aminotransferase